MTLVKAYTDSADDTETISTENTDTVKRLPDVRYSLRDGSVSFDDGKEQHIGDPT